MADMEGAPGTGRASCRGGSRRLDLAGMRFGRLTALEPAEDIDGQTAWRCRCDCGREAVVRTGYLTAGRVRHCPDPECSCARKNRRNLTGRRFGHLAVTGPDPDRLPKSRSFWRCRCDCGRETVVRAGNLTSGKVACCGHPACPHSPKRRAGARRV